MCLPGSGWLPDWASSWLAHCLRAGPATPDDSLWLGKLQRPPWVLAGDFLRGCLEMS